MWRVVFVVAACGSPAKPESKTPIEEVSVMPSTEPVEAPEARLRVDRKSRVDEDLTAEVRWDAPNVLASLVTGPLVVLDLDKSTFTTLCGPAAVKEARVIGSKLVDPKREKATCLEAPTTHRRRCVQVVSTGSNHELVIVELGTRDEAMFVGTVIGTLTKANALMIDRLDEEIAKAICP